MDTTSRKYMKKEIIRMLKEIDWTGMDFIYSFTKSYLRHQREDLRRLSDRDTTKKEEQ